MYITHLEFSFLDSLIAVFFGFVFNFYAFYYVGVLTAVISMYHMHVWCLWRPEDIRSPRTGATDDCELLCGC